MEKIRTYKVFGMVEVLVAATSPEQAKRIAIGRYGMDVRGTPEKAAHNVACEKKYRDGKEFSSLPKRDWR